MRNIPKEWLFGAGAALLALVLVVTSSSPGGDTVSVAPRGTYDPGVAAEPRWLSADFSSVWPGGADPFQPATDKKPLPAEDLGAPDFPPNPVPIIALRPSPDAKLASMKLTVAVATTMPSDDDIVKLRALGKGEDGGGPVVGPAPRYDVVVRKDGNKVEGTIVREDTNEVVIKLKKGGGAISIKRADIQSIDYALTPVQEYLKKSNELQGGKASEHLALADWCLDKGLLDQAIRELQFALQLRPEATTFDRLCELFVKTSDPDGQIRMMRSVLENPPGWSEEVWTQLGLIYEALELPSRAEQAYVEAGKKSRSYVEAHQRLARLYAIDGRFAEAEEQVSILGEGASKDLPETHLAAGTVWYFEGKMDVARADLLLAGPGGQRLLGCAEAYLGNADPAAAAFAKALTENPDDIDAWIDLGIVFGIAGEWPRAQACFDEAAYRAPASPHPQAASGWAALRQNKTPEATAAFGEALKRDPRCGLALFGLGKIANDAADSKGAEEKLLDAIKAGAGAAAFRELGLARLKLHDTSGAVEALRRAADVSNDPDAHTLFGFAILPVDPSTAEEQFRLALQANQDHVLALCGNAAVAYQRRDLVGARQIFQMVSERFHHPFADRGLRLVNEAASRTLWDDDFGRAPGESLRHQWVEREKEGLKIELAAEHARFFGKQNRNDGVTSMIHPTSEKFLSFEADVDFTKAGKATAGVLLSSAPGTGGESPVMIRFVRRANGKFAWWIGPANAAPNWTEGPDAPAEIVRMKLMRAAVDKGNEVQFWANGVMVGSIRGEVKSQKMEVGVFGSAFGGETWELTADNVRLIEAK